MLGGTPFEFESKAPESTKDDLSDDQEKTLNLIIKNSKDGNGTRRKDINDLFSGSKSRADKTIKFLLEENLIYQSEGSSLYWTLDSLNSSSAKSPKDSDTSLDSPKNKVEGDGSRGPGPKGPDPRTLPHTRSELLEECALEHILEKIDALNYKERGTEVLKAVASVYLNDLNLIHLMGTEGYIETVISKVKAQGVEITIRDLAKALRVLNEEFSFEKTVRYKSRKHFTKWALEPHLSV